MLWRNRSFLLLMIGEVVAGAGLWISIIANLQFMQHLVPSDFVKGLILMSGMLVGIFFAPKAGVMIDRYDKRKIMLFASLVRVLSPVCMFPALMYNSIAWMVLSLVIMQLTAVFYFPTVQSAIPSLLPPTELLKANSIYLNISTLSRIGGTAVGGVMIAAMDLSMLYLLSIVAYAILTVITMFIHIPKVEQPAGKSREKIEFREIFTLIKQEPAVIVGMINMGMVTLFLGGINLLILNFSETQQRPELMGYIYTVEGISILLAGLLAKRWVGSRNLVSSSSGLIVLFAIAQFGLSFSDSMWIVLASFSLFGVTVAFFFPMTTTIFQKRLPEHTHGRFFSFRGMYERTVFLVAVATTGACLDLMGISWYMILIGALTLLSAIVTLLYGKRHALDVRQTDSSTSPLSA